MCPICYTSASAHSACIILGSGKSPKGMPFWTAICEGQRPGSSWSTKLKRRKLGIFNMLETKSLLRFFAFWSRALGFDKRKVYFFGTSKRRPCKAFKKASHRFRQKIHPKTVQPKHQDASHPTKSKSTDRHKEIQCSEIFLAKYLPPSVRFPSMREECWGINVFVGVSDRLPAQKMCHASCAGRARTTVIVHQNCKLKSAQPSKNLRNPRRDLLLVQ